MPLFEVQDADRPMYVLEKGFFEALEYWRELVAIENEIKPDEVEDPQGVRFVCGDNDLIVNLNALANLDVVAVDAPDKPLPFK